MLIRSFHAPVNKVLFSQTYQKWSHLKFTRLLPLHAYAFTYYSCHLNLKVFHGLCNRIQLSKSKQNTIYMTTFYSGLVLSTIPSSYACSWSQWVPATYIISKIQSEGTCPVGCVYSGTLLNGQLSTADTHDITDNSGKSQLSFHSLQHLSSP